MMSPIGCRIAPTGVTGRDVTFPDSFRDW